ncbi:MAG: sigma-70 family RNA polymerase sigma factor [Candidatus Poribacteria bacterium]|nr:sigma-70 family RNA polymerase sigma factor [Candidatus Poribacteria bacterium]
MSSSPNARPLDALLQEVQPSVFALCYRLVGSIEDAEDLAQESLFKMARGYENFEGRAQFRTWAHRITTNTCYNFLKSARKRREIVVPDPLETTDEFLKAVDPDLDADELRESLEFSFICVLQELSPLQRLVVVLRDVLGWSVAETAEALGSAPAPVKNIHSRARKQLRKGRPARRLLSGSHPDAEAFMRKFAKAHVAADMDAILNCYDNQSVVVSFPTTRYRGKTEIESFYAPVIDGKMPTLFIGVKMNGRLSAACYHPNKHGSLQHTGVAIPEIYRPLNPFASPRIHQVFWAFQPEHFKRANLPSVIDSAEDAKKVGQLL